MRCPKKIEVLVLGLFSVWIVMPTSSGLVCCSLGRSWWASEAYLKLVLAFDKM